MKIIRISGVIIAMLVAAAQMAQESKAPVVGSGSSVTQMPPSSQPGLTWFTDFQKARTQAKAEGKSLLLFFHGSDWCPPCVQMQRQVLDSPEFAQFARQSLVLMDVDFPEKSKQSQELKQANLSLKAKFNLSPEWGEGYPTIVLLNATGETVFQETGYAGGGPAEVLPKLRWHAAPTASPDNSAGYRNLTLDEFAQRSADKANVVLDVRTAKEFEAGHIPGAQNVDVNAPGFEQKVAGLDKGQTYLVHCASGVRSVKACQILGRLGFTNLYNLPVGFRGWAREGKPVEK